MKAEFRRSLGGVCACVRSTARREVGVDAAHWLAIEHPLGFSVPSSKPTIETCTVGTVQNPGRSDPGQKMSPLSLIRSSTPRLAAAADALGGQQAGALACPLRSARGRVRTSSRPGRRRRARARRRARRDRPRTRRPARSHLLAAQERRVADDDVGRRARRARRGRRACVVGEDGVHVQDVVQGLAGWARWGGRSRCRAATGCSRSRRSSWASSWA